MTKLAATQHAFAAALLAATRPAGGMGVYHDNHRTNVRHALELAYPALRRLVGDEYFAQLVAQYLASTPSRSGDLHHTGAKFAPFVHAHFWTPDAAPRHACLGDVATLEWAWQEVFVAEDAPTLDPAALASIDESSWPALRFGLHPACRLVGSRYPIYALWIANRDTAGDAAVDLELCAGVSRDLSPALDVADLIPHRYHLEVSSPGIERLKWIRPVHPDDTLTATMRVVETRTSTSRPRMGLIRGLFEVANQSGAVVMRMESTLMMGRRAAA